MSELLSIGPYVCRICWLLYICQKQPSTHTPAETGSVMGCKTDRQTNNTFPHTQEHTCYFLTWLLCLGTWRIIQNVEYLAGCMMGFEHVMLQLQFCALCVLECQVLIPLLTLKRQCHENSDPLFAKFFVSCGVCIVNNCTPADSEMFYVWNLK